MKFLLVSLFLFTVNNYGQDLSTPSKALTYALNSITSGNFEALLKVTEGRELKNTQELLDRIGNDISKKEELTQEYNNLISWKIDSTDEVTTSGRTVSLVSTTWKVKVSIEKNSNIIKRGASERIVRIDYLLEKFGNTWKIIDRKSI